MLLSTHVGEELGKRQSTITSKCPGEARHRGQDAEGRTKGDDDYSCHHGSGCLLRLRRLIEDLNDGVSSIRVERIRNVTETVKQADQESKGECSVDDNGQDEDLRDRGRCFSDFLAHVDGSVETDEAVHHGQ